MDYSTLDKKELARLRKLEIKINLFAFFLGFAVSFVWNRITGDVIFAMFIFSFVTIVTTHWLFRKNKLHLVAKALEESEFPKDHNAKDAGGLRSLSPYHLGGRAYESYYVSSHTHFNQRL